MTRLEAFIRDLSQEDRTSLIIDRWREVENLADHLGVTPDGIRAALAATKPKARADRFQWLEAINVRHDLGVRALRTAVAVFSFADAAGYLWPSQRTLAARAGYRDEAELRRGIASLVAIGALRKVRLTDLPTQLAGVALGDVKAGGSGRSLRGIAYAVIAPSEWPAKGDTGTRCPSSNRDTVSLLNHQCKPPMAPPCFSPLGESQTIDSEYAESPVYSGDSSTSNVVLSRRATS